MGQESGEKPSIADLDRPTSRVRVERCVCFNQPFSKLLELARAEGLSQDELSERTGCCTGCGMCKPYVRVVLSTGRTSIPLMNGRSLKIIAEEAEATSARREKSSHQGDPANTKGVTASSFGPEPSRVESQMHDHEHTKDA